jgi:hypothetical protein
MVYDERDELYMIHPYIIPPYTITYLISTKISLYMSAKVDIILNRAVIEAEGMAELAEGVVVSDLELLL